VVAGTAATRQNPGQNMGRRTASGEHGAGVGAGMSAAFLAAIIEHVAHPIFVKDRQFRFVILNRALCEMVGYAREQMLGKTDYDFFPKEQADFFRQKDIEMVTSRQPVDIAEEPITDSHGDVHILATTKVPLADAAGEPTHLVGIIHDITRLKRAEDELRRANDELERRVRERSDALQAAQQALLRKERLAVLGQLSGGLAHQIRNPLGAIANAGFLLKRKLQGHPDPDVATTVDIVLEEAMRANRTITDLLEYARLGPPIPHPVEVEELIEATLGGIRLPSSVRLVRQVSAVPEVMIDPEQTRGALGNLIQNALEAMPEGGTLTLRAHGSGGREVVIAVEDTGIGVPASAVELLFEPLVTTKPLGTGLGLTTARALVENQGGHITWCSREGTGTTFEVHLPVA
jgi:PAS domain S-box-containing protein